MTDKDKIQLTNIIIKYLQEHKSNIGDGLPWMVGTLTKRQGINGFKPAEIGHPVFEYKDRYIIYVESETPLVTKEHGKPMTIEHYTVAISYYKETLEPHIDVVGGKRNERVEGQQYY